MTPADLRGPPSGVIGWGAFLNAWLAAVPRVGEAEAVEVGRIARARLVARWAEERPARPLWFDDLAARLAGAEAERAA